MKKLATFIISLLMAGGAYALTALPTGTQVDVAYEEPTQNVDGTPLQDLDHTTIYYDMGAGAVSATEVSASSPNGGGLIEESIIVPVGPNQESDVEIWATASDTTGNESPESNRVSVRIDRLPPAAPQ